MAAAYPLSFGQLLEAPSARCRPLAGGAGRTSGHECTRDQRSRARIRRTPYKGTIALLAKALGLSAEEHAVLEHAAGRHSAFASSLSVRGAQAALAGRCPLPSTDRAYFRVGAAATAFG